MSVTKNLRKRWNNVHRRFREIRMIAKGLTDRDHPIIARIRKRGMIAGMITNGYLLVADRIKRLNRAGLEHLQISIDNVMPDEVSKKSLKTLDGRLELLAQHAIFQVNIN